MEIQPLEVRIDIASETLPTNPSNGRSNQLTSTLSTLSPPSSGFTSYFYRGINGAIYYGGRLLNFLPFWNSSVKEEKPLPSPSPLSPATLSTSPPVATSNQKNSLKTSQKLESKKDCFTFLRSWLNLLTIKIKFLILSLFKILRMIFTLEEN